MEKIIKDEFMSGSYFSIIFPVACNSWCTASYLKNINVGRWFIMKRGLKYDYEMYYTTEGTEDQ